MADGNLYLHFITHIIQWKWNTAASSIKKQLYTNTDKTTIIMIITSLLYYNLMLLYQTDDNIFGITRKQ